MIFLQKPYHKCTFYINLLDEGYLTPHGGKFKSKSDKRCFFWIHKYMYAQKEVFQL